MKFTQVLASALLLLGSGLALSIPENDDFKIEIVNHRDMEKDFGKRDFEHSGQQQEDSAVLLARQGNPLRFNFIDKPNEEVKCPWNVNPPTKTFNDNDLNDAMDGAARLRIKNQQVGNGLYPHIYYNREGDINNYNGYCKGSDMWEFPIIKGQVYNGAQSPGNERLLFQVGQPSHNVYPVRYCGVMTHQGAPATGRFNMCKW
ncbi:hypothetical protein ACEPPN_010731 [Leptodophora sp. 'Broadleaf-Isolate-01']